MPKSKGGRRAERERNETIPLKDNLDRHYKPFFDQFSEQGGIPLSILEETLTQAGSSQQLNPQIINKALHIADKDSNKILDYEEFVKLMESQEMQGLDLAHMTHFRRTLLYAVSSVTPHKKTKDGNDYVEEYINHYTCCPPPIFMLTISLIELVLFIYYVNDMKKRGHETLFRSGAPLYSPLTYNPKRRYEAWRFLSYMFIHDGIDHIVFNLIFQLIIGLPLELVHKFWRVGIVYILGVIAGSIGSSFSDSSAFLVGASGGCYALIGAHFATIIMNWKNMTHDWMSGTARLMLSAPLRLFFWTSTVSLDVGIAIWSRHSDGPNISYSAHLAGAVAGLLVGVPVLKNLEVLQWEKALWWICIITYSILIILGICWNIFYEGFPPTDWRKCCPDNV